MQLIVVEDVADAVRARIADLDQPIDLLVVSGDGTSTADLSAATVFFRTHIGRDGYERVLKAATGLKWIHSGSAGVDDLDVKTLQARGITLTNSAGVYGVPIAEWVLFALLMIVKRGQQMIAAQEERRWGTGTSSDELTGKTLTILGIGGIGEEIAKRAAGFDMRVWGINRSGRSVPHVERIISGDDWRDALRETDFLVIATPLTAATRRLIGSDELAMLPSHAWVINIARGAIVDEPALIAALQDGTIAGAALDTFEQEPLPPDSPLWALPNVIVSPHHSGSSPRSGERMIDLFIDNLHRYLAHEELRNVVDLPAGY